jgi:hypothetical protein
MAGKRGAEFGGSGAFPAASQPLTASGGLPGVPGTQHDPERAHRAAEGVIEELARALEDSWLAGEQLNMDRPVGNRIDWLKWAHGIENRLGGLSAQVRAVDTDRVERGARAMFAVTNRADDWDEPSIPADLKDHYRRLARAVLEAR